LECSAIQQYVVHQAAREDCPQLVDHYAALCCRTQLGNTSFNVSEKLPQASDETLGAAQYNTRLAHHSQEIALASSWLFGGENDKEQHSAQDTRTNTNCDEFMADVERDVGKHVQGEVLTSGADGALGAMAEIGESMLKKRYDKKLVKSAFAIVGPFAGPWGALIGSTFAEFFIPDPNNERIEHLQKGMLCLDAKIKELEKEIDNLKDLIGENKAWISNLAQIPLRRKMSLVLLHLTDNRKCAQLMRCVEKDKSKVQTCQEEAQQLTSHCDVTAFVAKILHGNNYYFLREESTNAFNQIVAIEMAKEEEWKFARDFMGQYLALFISMNFLWNSLEEWATAICQTNPKCSEENVNKMKIAWGAFQKFIHTQVNDEKIMARKMKEAERKMDFKKSKLFDKAKIQCELSYNDLTDYDNTIKVGGTIGPNPPPNSKPHGHNDKTMHGGLWQPRKWRLNCGAVDFQRHTTEGTKFLMDKCKQKPCSVDISEDKIYELSGCHEKTYISRRRRYSSPEDLKKVLKNRQGNWAYDIGVLCDEKLREQCARQNKCEIDVWYQEYYNELDPDLDRLNKTGKILEERKIRNPPYAKAFEKTITIGSCGCTTKKCVAADHMSCYKNAGDRGIRVNADHKNANDAFIIETTANKVCAQRVDSASRWWSTWGMELQIVCHSLTVT